MSGGLVARGSASSGRLSLLRREAKRGCGSGVRDLAPALGGVELLAEEPPEFSGPSAHQRSTCQSGSKLPHSRLRCSRRSAFAEHQASEPAGFRLQLLLEETKPPPAFPQAAVRESLKFGSL